MVKTVNKVHLAEMVKMVYQDVMVSQAHLVNLVKWVREVYKGHLDHQEKMDEMVYLVKMVYLDVMVLMVN